jgi:hypothetical protein
MLAIVEKNEQIRKILKKRLFFLKTWLIFGMIWINLEYYGKFWRGICLGFVDKTSVQLMRMAELN